ncbi:hypothetical protein BbuMM1_R350 (plasmid) [Borreliella burgdorferi]|nr:hypothetical protein BbuMM1_R350 [Borreliella burgdorferi]
MKDFPSFYSLICINKYKYIAKTIFANFFTKILQKNSWAYLNSLVKELS